MGADTQVTCVVPVFNAESFLDAALQSIFSQTHGAIEIVAVDDGSTDGSAAVLARYRDRLTVLSQPNRGEAAARNAGIRVARGEFVAFLDADDLWEPTKIARQLDRLRAQPAIDLSFTRFQNFWTEEVHGASRPSADGEPDGPSASWSICTLLTRRSSFDRFGHFDEQLRVLPNMTWFVEAAKRGARVDVLPDVLMRRRLHDTNNTRTNRDPNRDEFFGMLKAWRDLQQARSR